MNKKQQAYIVVLGLGLAIVTSSAILLFGVMSLTDRTYIPAVIGYMTLVIYLLSFVFGMMSDYYEHNLDGW